MQPEPIFTPQQYEILRTALVREQVQSTAISPFDVKAVGNKKRIRGHAIKELLEKIESMRLNDALA